MEGALYALELRGSEVPKESLAHLFSAAAYAAEPPGGYEEQGAQ